MAGDTLTATYNDLDSVERLLQANKGQVAAVIVEPVAANMGVVPPAQGFLEGLRALCDEYHALLIFDEVITGFRLARGGAQEYFGVKADLVTFGKIIGGRACRSALRRQPRADGARSAPSRPDLSGRVRCPAIRWQGRRASPS